MRRTPRSGSFTVALATSATGIRDAAGNLSSFAATAPADGAAPVRTAMVMNDANANGKVDQVPVTFSETLASSTDTAPWTLANVPSGGTLVERGDRGRSRDPDDRRGRGRGEHRRRNLHGRARSERDRYPRRRPATSPRSRPSAPTDGAKPILVTLTMLDNNTNGKVDRVTAVFSETLAAYTAGTAPWTLANTPSGGTPPERGGRHDDRDADDHRGRGRGEHRRRQLHGRARDQRHRYPRRRRQPVELRSNVAARRGGAGTDHGRRPRSPVRPLD